MDLVETRVKTSLERAGYSGTDSLLVVAVSGGPDSLALLHTLLGLKESCALRIHVAHLNHNFRGEEAEEDARFVGMVASQLGLPATVDRADPVAYQRIMGISSFEEAAREVRYSFLAKLANKLSAKAVVLGHTADDLAETVLMHIIRGSGVPGLRGMQELSNWDGRTEDPPTPLFRPLLEVTKAQTTAYCQQHGIAFRTDSGNLSLRFTRNRVRHDLIPTMRQYNPKVSDALVRLSRAASMEVDYLEGELANVWPTVARQEDDSIIMDTGPLSLLHPFLRRMILRRAYQKLTGATRRIEEVHLQAMDKFIEAAAGKMLVLPKGLRLYAGYGRITMARYAAAPCPSSPLEGEHEIDLSSVDNKGITEVPGWRIEVRMLGSSPPEIDDSFTARFDAGALGDRLKIRSRRPGDRFQPSGMGVEKKLQDFYVDRKVPRDWRDRIPLLVSERGIVWVVGYRIAEWARISPESQSICEIRFSARA